MRDVVDDIQEQRQTTVKHCARREGAAFHAVFL